MELDKNFQNTNSSNEFLASYSNSLPYKFSKQKIESSANPIWLSVSEAAKLGGIQTKTVRRAIKSNSISFKVVKNRYQINFISFIKYLHSNTKLRNKLNQNGIGQYVEKWKKISKLST